MKADTYLEGSQIEVEELPPNSNQEYHAELSGPLRPLEKYINDDPKFAERFDKFQTIEFALHHYNDPLDETYMFLPDSLKSLREIDLLATELVLLPNLTGLTEDKDTDDPNTSKNSYFLNADYIINVLERGYEKLGLMNELNTKRLNNLRSEFDSIKYKFINNEDETQEEKESREKLYEENFIQRKKYISSKIFRTCNALQGDLDGAKPLIESEIPPLYDSREFWKSVNGENVKIYNLECVKDNIEEILQKGHMMGIWFMDIAGVKEGNSEGSSLQKCTEEFSKVLHEYPQEKRDAFLKALQIIETNSYSVNAYNFKLRFNEGESLDEINHKLLEHFKNKGTSGLEMSVVAMLLGIDPKESLTDGYNGGDSVIASGAYTQGNLGKKKPSDKTEIREDWVRGKTEARKMIPEESVYAIAVDHLNQMINNESDSFKRENYIKGFPSELLEEIDGRLYVKKSEIDNYYRTVICGHTGSDEFYGFDIYDIGFEPNMNLLDLIEKAHYELSARTNLKTVYDKEIFLVHRMYDFFVFNNKIPENDEEGAFEYKEFSRPLQPNDVINLRKNSTDKLVDSTVAKLGHRPGDDTLSHQAMFKQQFGFSDSFFSFIYFYQQALRGENLDENKIDDLIDNYLKNNKVKIGDESINANEFMGLVTKNNKVVLEHVPLAQANTPSLVRTSTIQKLPDNFDPHSANAKDFFTQLENEQKILGEKELDELAKKDILVKLALWLARTQRPV